MDNVSLEDCWTKRLLAQERWSDYPSSVVVYSLAESTRSTYNSYIRKLQTFCETFGEHFPPHRSRIIADFLCDLCKHSKKPKGMLHVALSAIKSFYCAMNISSDNVLTHDIDLLVQGLVKSSTLEPMLRSKVMPAEKFSELFCTWPDNTNLCIKDLRLKCITLMSLSLMLRPSDIAPRGVILDKESGTSHPIIFSTDNLEFLQDGSVKVTIFGVKNDATRTGFVVLLRPHPNPMLNPVSCLRCYIDRTDSMRDSHIRPVFLTLKKPYTALSSSQISEILSSAIKLAGLDNMGYTPKHFRATGATYAISSSEDPDIVRKLGRWKNAAVFYEHYVHTRTPLSVVQATIPDVSPQS